LQFAEDSIRRLYEKKLWMKEQADIIREFGYGSLGSNVICVPIGFAIDRTRHARCNVSFFAQRGWSVDISMKIVYVWQKIDRKKYGEYADDPKKVTIILEVRNNTLALDAAREKFSQTELWRQIAMCESTGQYDARFFYNSATFVSFPDNNVLELEDRKRTKFTLRITIPPELPDELLNVPIPIGIIGDTAPRRVGFSGGLTNVIIVA